MHVKVVNVALHLVNKYKTLWLVFYPLSRNVLHVAFGSCLQALFVYPVLALSKNFPLKVRFLALGRWASLMFVLKHLGHPLLHDVLPHHRVQTLN